MSTVSFLRLRLIGMRFEDHGVPLELLKDIAVLEEMVVEVAKLKFLKENANRQRSPRGFTKGVNLKLTTIEQGSAILNIGLVMEHPHQLPLVPPAIQNQLEAARDAIISAIGEAGQEQPPGQYFPGQALGYFDKIGRSLKAGEAVEFSSPEGGVTATLTKEIRRRLVRASSDLKELTEEVSIRGVVPEADQDDMTCEIQLIEGRKVKAPIAPQHLDTILEAFNGYQAGLRVLFQGIGRFSRSDRLLGLDSIEHLSILDALDVQTQLEELGMLQDGWLEGVGLAPPETGLVWLSSAFERYFPDEAPMPHIYPTETGGVQAEWSLGPNEITLEIDLSTHVGEWHVLNMDTNAPFERTLNCDDLEDWKWLVSVLASMYRGNG